VVREVWVGAHAEQNERQQRNGQGNAERLHGTQAAEREREGIAENTDCELGTDQRCEGTRKEGIQDLGTGCSKRSELRFGMGITTYGNSSVGGGSCETESFEKPLIYLYKEEILLVQEDRLPEDPSRGDFMRKRAATA